MKINKDNPPGAISLLKSNRLVMIMDQPLNCLLVVFFSTALLACSTQPREVSTASPSKLTPGTWQFDGHVGRYIDKIAHARILDQTNWETIYPETEEAFRLKEDDQSFPKFGRWRGEFWGKYMLSVIDAARYYKSEELNNRIADAVDGLLEHMDDDGYLGTYQRTDFLVGNNWNVWSRKYTLWGLVACWELLRDPEILAAAQKFADHLISEVGPEAVDIVRTGNFYGMPSTSILQPMVKLFNATGEDKYLHYAIYIVDQWEQHPEGLPNILNKGLTDTPVHLWFPDHDPLKWAKGYEFISCVEGLVELYKVTRKEEYLRAAKNIHDLLVTFERTPVGSLSFNDKLIGSAGLINTVAEICDAVYWNRLSYELFKLTGDEKYVDEIERTLYNSLLCAFNPEGTWGLRRLRTSHQHIPAQNHFLNHHQCCTDNLPRGLFQAADLALMQRGEGEVYLTIFNPGKGVVFLKDEQVSFTLSEDFLETSEVEVELSLAAPQAFLLNIRAPRWSSETSIRVNGKPVDAPVRDGWIALERTWQENDIIEVAFDLNLHWEVFQPEKLDTSFHDIDFYNDEWAKLKFLGGTYAVNNERYQHVVGLDSDEALPQQEAMTFFYGPLALARDIRVTDQSVFAPISEPVAGKISLKSQEAPPAIWKQYEVNLGSGQVLRFCDFSSAGNTWDDQSLFNTWCMIAK